MWEGPIRPCGFAAARSSCYKMWAGLNGFDPRTDFVLGGVRIGMGCMNLVTVISRYTWVPVTLRVVTPMGSDHPLLSFYLGGSRHYDKHKLTSASLLRRFCTPAMCCSTCFLESPISYPEDLLHRHSVGVLQLPHSN